MGIESWPAEILISYCVELDARRDVTVSQWEMDFLETMLRKIKRGEKTTTPKQRKIIERMYYRYGEA